jgi:hypothetical protein
LAPTSHEPARRQARELTQHGAELEPERLGDELRNRRLAGALRPEDDEARLAGVLREVAPEHDRIDHETSQSGKRRREDVGDHPVIGGTGYRGKRPDQSVARCRGAWRGLRTVDESGITETGEVLRDRPRSASRALGEVAR